MEKGKYKADDIAKWFLNENRKQMNFEDAEYITDLKLQKLLYYAQGCYSAKYNKSLIKENFLAWEHGPVIKEVYDKYKKFGSNGIIFEEDYNHNLDEETENILKKVFRYFGKYSAWGLRNMTHNETPWKNTEINNIISKEIIKNYFKENYRKVYG